ncbi:MAG: LAGLIDADG family homing endonuclease [Nitrososphaerota archaeon]
MVRRVYVDTTNNFKPHIYRRLDARKKIEIYNYAIALQKSGLGYKRVKKILEEVFNVKIGLTTLRNWFNKHITPLGLGPLIREVAESPVLSMSNEAGEKNYERLSASERLRLRDEALRICAKGYGPYKAREVLRLKYNVSVPRGAITGWIYRGSLPQGRKRTNLTPSPSLTTCAAISTSDGSLCKGRKRKLSLQVKDLEPIKAFVEALKEITDRLDYDINYDPNKGIFYTQVYRGDLLTFLSDKNNVINLLRKYPREFIQTYFECEGGPYGYVKIDKKSGRAKFEAMIIVTNTDEQILDIVREELRKMKIYSVKRLHVRSGRKSILKNKEVITKKDCYALIICRKDSIIRFYEKIGFLSMRKQEKLKTIVNILTKFRTKERRAIEWLRLYEHRAHGRVKWIKREKPLTVKEAKELLKTL